MTESQKGSKAGVAWSNNTVIKGGVDMMRCPIPPMIG